MQTPYLVSIQAGLPRTLVDHSGLDKRAPEWTSGIYKFPVQGPAWLTRTNLAGDGQADLKHHGGPDQAVLAYSVEAYAYWEHEYPDLDWSYGAFGENFTISGLRDDTVCVDDVFQIGEVMVQASRPRSPCWKLARRLGIKDAISAVWETGWAGWYFRVLQEGPVEAGLPVTLIERSTRRTMVEANQENRPS